MSFNSIKNRFRSEAEKTPYFPLFTSFRYLTVCPPCCINDIVPSEEETMATSISEAHRVMSQRVQITKFCEEEEGRWNTRLLYILEEFDFIGDFVRLTEDDFYRETSIGRNTMARLKAFLASHGLSLGMTGPIVESWVRPN